MSEQDRELLERAGLSASKVAKILGRSRQAVSKGLAADADYLSPTNLIEISKGVAAQFPDQSEPMREAVSDLFRDLAERLGARLPDQLGMAANVSTAHRLWLILPGYTVGFAQQPKAYLELFSMIDQRRPAQHRSVQLEVVIFCDKGRPEIEEQFDHSWFDTRQLAVVQCGLVSQMFMPVVVVDPHLDGSTGCYTLARDGFEPLDPAHARSRVFDFAESVSEKIRRVADARAGRSVNVLTATPATLLDAGVDRMQI